MADNNELRFTLETFELYNLARAFRRNIYRLIKELPPVERYCLAPQMRRADISVSNNVAEGHGRWHYKENIQYCRTSLGSVEEIIDDLNVCIDESYVDETTVVQMKSEAHALITRINGYISYLRRCQQGDNESGA
jgi:four helix bundle protein